MFSLFAFVHALSRSQFLTDFDEIWLDVWNLNRKIPFFGGENPIRVSPILLHFTPNWNLHNTF